MKTGKIVITDKVYFEPDRLEKPKMGCKSPHCRMLYNRDMKAYEASKRLIEVSNKIEKIEKCYEHPIGKYFIDGLKTFGEQRICNGQPCKAEVNGTAIIIELIK